MNDKVYFLFASEQLFYLLLKYLSIVTILSSIHFGESNGLLRSPNVKFGDFILVLRLQSFNYIFGGHL